MRFNVSFFNRRRKEKAARAKETEKQNHTKAQI